MTKTASKAGLKAAATAKTEKAAQRTPLPPKQKAAKEQDTLAMITAAAREVAREKQDANSKSWEKAKPYIAAIQALGWSTSAGRPQGSDVTDHVEVIARRGNETLFIEWVGGVHQPTSSYTIADREVKIKNASAAKARAAMPADDATAELERVRQNKVFRKREQPSTEAKQARLPFDPATAGDAEIANAVAGHKISWINRYRDIEEDAYVRPDPREIHFTEHDGERIMNFLCPTTGYRACRVAAITRVGRAHSIPTMSESEGVKAKRAAKRAGRVEAE